VGHNTPRKYYDPKEYKRAWNRRNKKSIDKKRKSRRQKKKGKLLRFLGARCASCGLGYDGTNACVFDFHHRNMSEKEFRLNCDIDWNILLTEAEKCDILCSNCHRTTHSGKY